MSLFRGLDDNTTGRCVVTGLSRARTNDFIIDKTENDEYIKKVKETMKCIYYSQALSFYCGTRVLYISL